MLHLYTYDCSLFFKNFFFKKLGVPRIGPVGDVIILHDKCCDLALFCGFYRQIDIVPLRLTASQCGGSAIVLQTIQH